MCGSVFEEYLLRPQVVLLLPAGVPSAIGESTDEIPAGFH